MFAISGEELEAAPKLGDFILCRNCGKRHIIKHGEEILKDGTRVQSSLAFFECEGKQYLAGFNGKDIRR